MMPNPQTIVVGGITGPVFTNQAFNEARCSKLADLFELHSVGGSKQLVHRVFQRYAHGRDKNFRWMCVATDRFPGMIEAIENQFGGIDERAIQIEENSFAIGHVFGISVENSLEKGEL